LQVEAAAVAVGIEQLTYNIKTALTTCFKGFYIYFPKADAARGNLRIIKARVARNREGEALN
jgi:hypothetical protein